MLYVEELKRDLTDREAAIWQGRSGLAPETEAAYRLRWRQRAVGGPTARRPAAVASVPVSVPKKSSLPCIHLGEAVGSKILCPSCRGHVEVQPFVCAVHGTCSQMKRLPGVPGCCNGCPDKLTAQPAKAVPAKTVAPLPATHYPPVTTRNLLYHVYPLRGSCWKWNVDQLLRRIGLFNGKRIVAIAVDDGTDPADDVRRAFGDAVQFVVVPNAKDRWDGAAFEAIYSRVESVDPGEVTFWAHAKGVTSRQWAGDAPKLWAAAMYAVNLDYWPVVERLLARRPVVGAFKRQGKSWEASASLWHYSGSFHWFRHAPLFSQPNWREIDAFYGCMESYPSIHFADSDAGNLFYGFSDPGQPTLYQEAKWAAEITPALQMWQSDNREDFRPSGDIETPSSQSIQSSSSSQSIIDDFHRLYYDTGLQRRGTWTSTFWRGVAVEKCPLDLHIYQEIIHEVRPGLIIETGTKHGGSALFLADMCELVGNGCVVSIDIAPDAELPEHPRLTYALGSSTDPAIVQSVRCWLACDGPVLVILDSDHGKEHVLAEMRAYAPLVTVGSYLIVEDGNIGGHPVSPGHGAGPWEAVAEFLAEHPEFAADREREKLLLTFNPGGYLRRLASP